MEKVEVYLDYAATSAIRPPEVVEAVTRFLTDVGATPGRSGHSRSIAAGRVMLRCRQLLARLLGITGDPGRITFQHNATVAINTAILGLVSPGGRVVRTRFDHNAVLRSVASLQDSGVRESVIEVGAKGEVDLAQTAELLQRGVPPRLVVVPHASNVTGTVLPVRRIADLAHEAGALLLVDLAQTAGHVRVDLNTLGADLAAFTGHKGLLGPQGTGGLWVREGIELRPLFFGGTGSDSLPRAMPEVYPDHLEAGTQNSPGLAGLAAGVEWILDHRVEALAAREQQLKQQLLDGLSGLPDVRIVSTNQPGDVALVTMVHNRFPSDELALRVERSHGIQGRPGLHCAPDTHAVLGTLRDGAFRLSIGWATTGVEIDQVIEAIRALE